MPGTTDKDGLQFLNSSHPHRFPSLSPQPGKFKPAHCKPQGGDVWQSRTERKSLSQSKVTINTLSHCLELIFMFVF